MHITKQSPEVNKMLKLLLISSVVSTSSAITFANESHQMTEMDHSAHQMTSMNEASLIDHSQHYIMHMITAVSMVVRFIKPRL